jgi:flagellar biosynthesis regulator FlaF
MHLPAELRRDILNLSLYVAKQTIKALTDPKAEHLGALVEIDRTVARGLTPAA